MASEEKTSKKPKSPPSQNAYQWMKPLSQTQQEDHFSFDLFLWLGLRSGLWLTIICFSLFLLFIMLATARLWTGTPTGSSDLVSWLNASQPLLWGALWFALLGRLFELAYTLWGQSKTPSSSSFCTWQEVVSLKEVQKQISCEALAQQVGLCFAFGDWEIPEKYYVAEKGRSSAIGELWLLIGSLIAIGILTIADYSLWTRGIMITTPWLIFGALLQISESYRKVVIWQQEDELVLWGLGRESGFQLKQELTSLRDALELEFSTPTKVPN